jgi:hypothetical protein
MIDMTDSEMSKLAILLTANQDAFMQVDRGADQVMHGLARMWLVAAITDGLWRASGLSAVVTVTSLDLLLPEFDGELAALCKRMAGYLRGRIAAYEAEIRKVQGMSRH